MNDPAFLPPLPSPALRARLSGVSRAWTRPHRLSILFMSAALLALAGCKTAPPQPAPEPGVATPGTAAPAPAPAPAPVAAPVQRSEAEIRQLLDNARNLLDQGQEEVADAELQKVLESDPNQRTAQALQRTIRDDPTTLYGRESFPYRVAVGDTLAIISQRLLGDANQFYGLARYNGIKVPRQLQVGQTIRVPGKAPRNLPPAPASTAVPASPPPAPAPAPAAPPPPPPAPAPAAAPNPQAEARAKQAQVEALSRQARVAMARQDVCGAIGAWNRVLDIDPGNRSAELELAKAQELKKKLPASKC
jgi:LysM repeat protein